MRNLLLRVISFKQSADEPEYLYALSEREAKLNDYVYMRKYGRFACIQHCLHTTQFNNSYPIIEATNNVKYGLPVIPQVFVKRYFEGNKEQKVIQLRLK